MLSGDIGVNNAGEATLAPKATVLDPASRLMADKVRLLNDSQVYDVFYNDLLNKGNILGSAYTPLELPLVDVLPFVPDSAPGGRPVYVPRKGSLTLEPGNYGAVFANRGSTLVLTGGVYDFSSVYMFDSAQLLIEGPVEIRVSTRLHTGRYVKIMPAESAVDLTAADLRIIVVGKDETHGKSKSRAILIGSRNELRANFYVPQGSLAIGSRTKAAGAFLGQIVMIGDRVELSLESGW